MNMDKNFESFLFLLFFTYKDTILHSENANRFCREV